MVVSPFEPSHPNFYIQIHHKSQTYTLMLILKVTNLKEEDSVVITTLNIPPLSHAWCHLLNKA